MEALTDGLTLSTWNDATVASVTVLPALSVADIFTVWLPWVLTLMVPHAVLAPSSLQLLLESPEVASLVLVVTVTVPRHHPPVPLWLQLWDALTGGLVPSMLAVAVFWVSTAPSLPVDPKAMAWARSPVTANGPP